MAAKLIVTTAKGGSRITLVGTSGTELLSSKVFAEPRAKGATLRSLKGLLGDDVVVEDQTLSAGRRSAPAEPTPAAPSRRKGASVADNGAAPAATAAPARRQKAATPKPAATSRTAAAKAPAAAKTPAAARKVATTKAPAAARKPAAAAKTPAATATGAAARKTSPAKRAVGRKTAKK